MIKANFIQVSLTNHMLQLVSSDLAAPHKRDTWSQKSPSNTHFGIVFKFAEIFVASHLKKIEQTYS